VHWFKESVSIGTSHITLEPCDSFVSYEDGDQAKYSILPKQIQRKFLLQQELTNEEKVVKDSMALFEQAHITKTPASIAVYDPTVFAAVPCDTATSTQNTIPKNLQQKAVRGTRTAAASHVMPKQGDRVAVLWDGDGVYYNGVVQQVRESFYNIHYDDSDTEWLPLAECDFKILDGGKDEETKHPPKMANRVSLTDGSPETENFVDKAQSMESSLSGQVDLGTKVCLTCKLGPTCHEGNDVTCPRSINYEPAAAAPTCSTNNQSNKGKSRKEMKKKKKRKQSKSTSATKHSGTSKRARKAAVEERQRKWTTEEDSVILGVLARNCETPWATAAKSLPGRNAGSIRNRWRYNLDPALDHSPFSRHDDLQLWKGQQKLGQQWAKIASEFFASKRSPLYLRSRWLSAAFKLVVAEEFGPKAYEIATTGEPVQGKIDNDDTKNVSSLETHVKSWKDAVSKKDAVRARDCMLDLYRLLESADAVEDELDIGTLAEEHDLQTVLVTTQLLMLDHSIPFPSEEVCILEGLLSNDDFEENVEV